MQPAWCAFGAYFDQIYLNFLNTCIFYIIKLLHYSYRGLPTWYGGLVVSLAISFKSPFLTSKLEM